MSTHFPRGLDSDSAPDPDGDSAVKVPKARRGCDTELQDQLHTVSVDVKLTADWIEDCVEKSTYITFPSGVEGVPFQCVQFLNVQKKIILLPSFRGDSSHTHLWNVQPFGTWHGTVHAAPKSIDVFVNGEPLSFNVHKYIAEVQPSRVDFREWDCGVSDSAGWILMHSGRQLVPRSSLQSATVPILALTDALDAQDFICVARSVDHYPRQGKLYDGRKLQGKRCYLQAVMASAWLWANGQKQFSSTRPQSYYLAILRKPGEVGAKLSGKECLAILSAADGPNRALPLPPPTSASKRPLALADIDGDEGDVQPAAKRVATLALMDVDGDVGDDNHTDGASRDSSSTSPSSLAATASSSSGSSGGSHDIDGDDGGVDRPHVPKFILGRRTRVEVHRSSGDRGMRVTCPTHGHVCRRFRSLEKDCELYGAFGRSFLPQRVAESIIVFSSRTQDIQVNP